jgi:hypothetical protein
MTKKNVALTLAGVAVGATAAVVASVMSGPSASSKPAVLESVGSTQSQIGAAAAATSTNGNNGNTDPATGCNVNGNCVKDFGVAVGALAGLYPGASKTIAVTYSNPNNFPIYVTTATTTAKLTTPAGPAPSCSADYLVTGTYDVTDGGLAVPKNGRTSTTLPVGLRSTAPDACKGASWQVIVTAKAVK